MCRKKTTHSLSFSASCFRFTRGRAFCAIYICLIFHEATSQFLITRSSVILSAVVHRERVIASGQRDYPVVIGERSSFRMRVGIEYGEEYGNAVVSVRTSEVNARQAGVTRLPLLIFNAACNTGPLVP